MVRVPIQLGVSRAHLKHQHAAEVQTCVPAMDLKGDSYRLRDKDLGTAPPAEIG